MICNWCYLILSIFILAFCLEIKTVKSNATLQELPDEYDDFRAIRLKNKLYVDKSHYINLLLQSEEKFFSMCRPGRFGKSNFLQMLRSFFKGEKEQFEGLDIFEKHDWKPSPVIYLDFSVMDVSTLENFEACLNLTFILEGRSYGIELDQNLPLYSDRFHNVSKLGQLIDHLTENGKRNQSIVVLIDEYDWPIRQYQPGYVHNEVNQVRRLQIRSFLSPFFQQLELMKHTIKLLFFTCTTKISYANTIDSERKPITLKDLTFEPQFSGMIGLTGQEVESNLKPHIGAMVASKANNETFRTLISELRRRYNGYCFTRENASECRLYNFRSVMSCLRKKKVDNFWHPVKDSKYNLFEDYQDEVYRMNGSIFNMSGLTVSYERIQKHYTLADIPIVVGLIFCGYLTFRGYNEQTREFSLDFPNDEIRESYRRAIHKYVLGKEISSEEFLQKCETIRERMVAGGTVNFVESLNDLAFKPADGIILLDHDFYSYERIARIFEGCDYCLHENDILSENERFNVTIPSLPDDWMARGEYKYGMRIELTNCSGGEYRINFEFGRSAACAMNVLLKAISAEGEVRHQSTHNRVAHLVGINFGTSGDALKDWIGITYFEGKCKDVHASHLHYEKMYAYLVNQTAHTRLV